MQAKIVWEQIRGKTVHFVHDGAHASSAELRQAAARHKMTEVPIHAADVFVLPDAHQGLGQEAALTSHMRGAYQVWQQILLTNGVRGTGVKFHASAAVQKVLF